MQQLKDEEDAGSRLDFRCRDCQSCSKCKESNFQRARSIREEKEQLLIDQSVEVDTVQKKTWCELPFTRDPHLLIDEKWGGNPSNINMTRHVLRTQCKLPLKKREGIVNFIDELRSKGFICPLEELPTPDRQVVEDSDIHHFYCWRSVANPSSVSTPVRVVVDPTMSGLNGCLPKGANNLCNLLELQIDFRCNVVAYSYDISKMYNSLRMKAC